MRIRRRLRRRLGAATLLGLVGAAIAALGWAQPPGGNSPPRSAPPGSAREPERIETRNLLPKEAPKDLIAGTPVDAAPADETPIRVLFLGDQGHHHPANLASLLRAVMAGRQIDVAYTERLADLNARTLASYDVLLIYANIERIEPAQEKALLDFVEVGGGLVALHCASYCFHNSPAYVALVGGQFDRHGTSEFETRVVAPDHPIMQGFAPFRTWDETYVHRRHNAQDRVVLQARPNGAGEEPYTWVRAQGNGRVFYTAYGHDERCWSQSGFLALVERGVRWAAKRDVFDSRMKPREGLPPFAHAPAKAPRYAPNTPKGQHLEPLDQMQLPVAPDESQRHLVAPRGFDMSLFAAEPEIGKPIAAAWDHRGRLWIAESTDYPNDLQPPGEGRDRIRILEDTDGDGRADKFTLFAERLSIPTSLLPVRGGVIVHQAPVTLLLRDADGDDREDQRVTLLDGWGTRDTHSGPSNLHWGFDNWIWSIVGYSGFKGVVGGEQHQFSQGLFRFKPDGSKLEFLRSTSNNSWGLGFDESGLVFGSTANGNPSVFMPIPNRYYEAVRGWSPGVLERTAVDNHIEPITDKVRQVDWFGGFTAASGHALYTARTWPRTYWNRTAFVCEPTGHLVATFFLEPRGSDFVTRNSWNQLASDDEWTAPIWAEVGPDGNLWVIDWYNYIVQHNPTPHGFENGKGNAYVTPLRDKQRARIYRVAYRGAPSPAPPKLDPEDPDSLATALGSDNLLWRMQAQRLLVERGKSDVAPRLVELTKTATLDAIGSCPAALHAICSLAGLAAVDEAHPQGFDAVTQALRHPAAGVRRIAAQNMPRTLEGLKRLLAAGVLDDADAQTRLAALLAIAEMPPSPSAAQAVLSALSAPRNLGDRWIPDAALAAAAAHDRFALLQLAAGAGDAKADAAPRPRATPPDQDDEPRPRLPLDDRTRPWIGRLAEHFARGKPTDAIGTLLVALAPSDPAMAETIVPGLARGWPKNTPLSLDPAASEALVNLFERLPAGSRSELLALARKLGSTAFSARIVQTRAALLATACDAAQSDEARIKAAQQAVELEPSKPEAARRLLELLSPRLAPTLVNGLLDAVSRCQSAEIGPTLVSAFAGATPEQRRKIVGLLLGRAEWTPELLQALEGRSIATSDLALDERTALADHPDPKLAARAKALLAQSGGLPSADRQKVIDSLAPLTLSGGDPLRGKLAFANQCAKCHMHSGEGRRIGPDLTGMAVHPRQELLIHILDPSRSVEGNFRQYSVVTDEGRVLSGLLSAQTKTAIQLTDAEGKTHEILRENIEELRASQKSLMPDGFEKQLSPDALADLLAFLTQRGRFLPLDLRPVATIASTQGMFYSAESRAERLALPDWSGRSIEGIPFQFVDPEGTSRPNVILLHSTNGKFPPKMPKSVRLPCNGPAKALHLLSGVSGWGAQRQVRPTVSLIVRLHYADGAVEDHPLQNGVQFADYIRRFDVPESKFAFACEGGQQVRYLAVYPARAEAIRDIELVKGDDATAPLVMAVTVETDQPK